MKTLLAIIPILALIAGLILYRYKGKRQILRFDLAQFFYAFVLMPVVYVWFKSFLFLLLQSYAPMSQTAVLFWDTAYSVFFLFLYAFTVIHSLTKSFKLQRTKDPLYDLLEHSEYYHLWVSHTILYGGIMLLFFFLAAVNAWIDLPWIISVSQFYGFLATALITAWLVFRIFITTNLDGGYRFVKLMKLFVAIFFVLHILLYAVFEPPFIGAKTMYWYQFTLFLSLSCIGIIHPSELNGARFSQRIRKRAAQLRQWFRFKK